MKRASVWVIGSAVAAALLACVPAAQAGDTEWDAGEGNWDLPSNWTSGRPGRSGMSVRSPPRPSVGTTARTLSRRVRLASRPVGPRTENESSTSSPDPAWRSSASHWLMTIWSSGMSGGTRSAHSTVRSDPLQPTQ